MSNELFIYLFPSLQRVVRHNLPIGRYVLNYFVFWSEASNQDGYVFFVALAIYQFYEDFRLNLEETLSFFFFF